MGGLTTIQQKARLRAQARRDARNHEMLEQTAIRARLASLTQALVNEKSYIGVLGTGEVPTVYIEAAENFPDPKDRDAGILVPIQEFRDRMAQVIDLVQYHNKVVWITKRDEPVLMVFREDYAKSPIQDLLDRDRTPAPEPTDEDQDGISGKIDALGDRIEASLRALPDYIAEVIEEKVLPLRTTIRQNFRNKIGEHPNLTFC